MRRTSLAGLVAGVGLGVSVAGFSLLKADERERKPARIPRRQVQREIVTPLPKVEPSNAIVTGDGAELLPIDWPAVLELARASNIDVQIASEKVHESQVTLQIAQTQWIPSLKLGARWLHHEGRIQEIDGRIIDASKSQVDAGGFASLSWDPQKVAVDVLKAKQQVRVQRGALDKTSRDTLQQASMAYVDVVASQGGVAIAKEIHDMVEEVLDRSRKLQKSGVGPQIDVLRNTAQVRSQQQLLEIAKNNQVKASAKLAQLLGLPPKSRLVAADSYLAPMYLVNHLQPEEMLMDQARASGPGLVEIQAMICTFDEHQRRLRQISLLPNIQANAGGGTLGGGIGGSYDNFNGTADFSVAMYWDVTRIIGTTHTRELFASNRRQACLKQQQALQMVEAGVSVARASAISAQERIKLAEMEIQEAVQAYKLSKTRLDNAETLAMEVLQAIGGLASARSNYVNAVIEFNRAQIQLMYLLGFDNCSTVSPGQPPAPTDSAPSVEPKPAPAKSAQASPTGAEVGPIESIPTVIAPVDPPVAASADVPVTQPISEFKPLPPIQRRPLQPRTNVLPGNSPKAGASTPIPRRTLPPAKQPEEATK